MDTASGVRLDLEDPHPDDIRLADIAAALSKVCRFGAQAKQFYSVAQHAVLVHDLVVKAGQPDLAPMALHHDSAEAFVCDLPSPLKGLLEARENYAYREVSDRLDRAIAAALGHEPYDQCSPDGAHVKLADQRALLIEAAELLPDRGEGIRGEMDPERVAEIEELTLPFPELLAPVAAEKAFRARAEAQALAGEPGPARARPADRAAQLENLYEEIHRRYSPRDSGLVPRRVVPEALESRVLLVAQALGRDTQRLSGLPYCFPTSGRRLSKGGQVLDAFLRRFGHTINPNGLDQYAYHTDIAHYYPGRRPGGTGDIEPSAEEIKYGRDWLERELALVEPEVVILLGKSAAALFLQTYGGRRIKRLGDVLGQAQPCRVNDREVPAFAVHHPSGAWQFPEAKRVYERTVEKIGAILR